MHVLLPQVRVNNDAHIETLERKTYSGRIKSPFTAHPKIDPVTGELRDPLQITHAVSPKRPRTAHFTRSSVLSGNETAKLGTDVLHRA
jgi:carotenoid cleavage dioxygenase-like enzyme